MRYLVIILGLLFSTGLYGQEFSVTTIEQTADNIIVHYNLLDTTKGRNYVVYLYLLQDNSISPLQKVSEHVGIGVSPGANKRIVWAAREELGSDFNGSIQLEVRGKVYVPFLEFQGFPENKVVKRGKAYTYSWTGQSRSKIINVDLYQGNELKYSLPQVANTGKMELALPKSVKPGKYRFLISDSKNKDLAMQSPTIVVKNKVPFLMKLLPLAIVGGGTYFVWSEAAENKTDELDLPPDPPKN